jgi:hypothetical protein
MFVCVMCKEKKEGTARVKNNAGQFCDACWSEANRRSVEAQMKKKKEWDWKCVWCGGNVEKRSEQLPKLGRVCKFCSNTFRPWVLKCVRYSSKLCEHVQRIEIREQPERTARKKAVKLRGKNSGDDKITVIDTYANCAEICSNQYETFKNYLSAKVPAARGWIETGKLRAEGDLVILEVADELGVRSLTDRRITDHIFSFFIRRGVSPRGVMIECVKPFTLASVKQYWNKILETLRERKAQTYAMLAEATPTHVEVVSNTLVISYKPGYEWHAKKISDSKRLQEVELSLEEIYNRKISVVVDQPWKENQEDRISRMEAMIEKQSIENKNLSEKLSTLLKELGG